MYLKSILNKITNIIFTAIFATFYFEIAEHLLNFLKQINDINCVLFNHLIAPFVDVCVRLCMGGVYVIGTILKKEH